MTIKWNCLTRKACYLREVVPDWAILDGCFAPKRNVKPMDVDGIVEQNGRFLFLEQKSPARGISGKQIVMFRALAAQGHTCIVFWGRDGLVQSMTVYGPGIDAPVKRPATLDDLRMEVRRWWLSVYKSSGPGAG